MLLNISIECCVSAVFLGKVISTGCLHVSELKEISHSSAQLSTSLRSLFNVFDESNVFLIVEKSEVSSANILTLDRRPSVKSLMKTRKNKGPRMEP